MGTENIITLRIAAEDAFSSTLEKAELAFAMLGQEVLAELSKIHGAFQTLNLKSALDIDTEKARMLDAFNQIKFSGVSSAEDIKRAQVAYHAELEKLDQQLKKTTASTDNMGHSMHEAHGAMDMMKGMLGAMAFGAIIMELQQLAVETFESTIKLQALEVQFKTVFNSSELAAQNLRFVREESDRLGLVFIDTADAFAKFAASAKGTSLEGEGVRRVFTGVTEAVTAMHLPAETSQRIFAQLSQMMSKNKITAEDLNVVAESLPGTYTVLAQSLNLTTAEMRQQMESGKLLASDVLPKLSEQLHLTYGGAAVEGAKSAQAQFNRFKNTMVDVGVTIGEAVLPALLLLSSVLSGVGGTIKYLLDLLGPGAPVAIAFAAGIGTLSLAWKVLTAEVIASTAAFLVNPIFMLVAAGTAAVLGVAAAIKAVADAMGLTGDASEKSAAATARALQASQEKAAAEKKILDDYEKAVGISLDRQLAKEQATYEESILAVHKKWEADIAAAGNNAAEVKRLEDAKNKDLEDLAENHLAARQRLRDRDAEDHRKYYRDSLQVAINYYKAVGDKTAQDVNEYKLRLAKKIEDVERYYASEIDKAQGNVVAIIGLEDSKQKAIAKLKEQASQDHALIGLDNQKKELDNQKQSDDALIAEVKLRVSKHLISEKEGQDQVLALQIQSSQRLYENRLAYAEQVKKTYGEDSEEYKAAIKEQESAHAAYVGKSIELTKTAEAQRKAEWDLTASIYKNTLDRELGYIQEYCTAGTISTKEAAVQRLAVETDYFEKIKRLRAEQLAALDPVTQALEYQKALSAKMEADRQYDAHYHQLLVAREKLTRENEAAVTERYREELEKRKKADQEALQQQRAYAASWFALWDNAYNNGAASLKKLSTAAYNAFAGMNKLPLALEDSIQSVSAAAKQAEKDAFEMGKAAEQAGMLSGAVWGPTIKNLQMISVNAKQVEADFLKQKFSALTLAEGLERLKGATPAVIRAAEDSLRNFKLLDNASLDKIKGQIERLKGIVESFRDSIKSTVSSLQDELDNLTLSKSALETKRYEQQFQDLNQKLRQAVELNDQESADSLKKAIANAKTIHEIKMKNLAEEAAAAKNTDSATTDSGAGRKIGFNRGGRFPGNSLFDTLQVWARPGEWFVQNEAADFWGDNFMAAINEPWTQAGQEIQQRLSGFAAPAVPDIPLPQVAFSTGGRVSAPEPAEKSTTRVELVAPSGQMAAGDFSMRDARTMLNILQEVGLRTT